MTIDLIDNDDYTIIDECDDYGVGYFKLSGNGESFWCRIIEHDQLERVFTLIVDQLLTGSHPFVYGDVLLISDSDICIEL